MDSHSRDLGRELRQHQRAIARGALVLKPQSEYELRSDERANAAEIDMLERRRQSLWSQLSSVASEATAQALSYEVEAVTQALDVAFADRRRLRVARDLFESKTRRAAA